MNSIYNTTKMIRFILRRDRVYLTLWILGLVSLATFFVPMMPDVLGDEQSRLILIEMMKNPAMIAIMGLPYDEGNGPLFSLFMMVWTALAIAIFNIFFIVRHTRKDEEEGRREIISSLPLGRNAGLAAALIVVFIANLIIGLLTAVIIPAFNVSGIDAEGAAVFAAAIAVCGLFFAALSSLFVQVFNSSRSTTIAAFLALGAFYLLRAAGDMESDYEILALVSPLGIIERTEAWYSNDLWPIFVLLALSLALMAIAYVLSSIRDIDTGILPQKTGSAHASATLRGEWSLAWRLTRGICIGWFFVMFFLGLTYGSIFNEMASFMDNNDVYSAMITGGAVAKAELMASFTSYLEMLMAVIAAIPVCMVVLKLWSEEKKGHLEQVLAKSVDRSYLMSGFVLIALALAVLLLLATPIGMYSAAALVMDSPPELSMMVKASLNYLPALLIFISLATLFVGAFPRFSPALWVYLGFCALVSYIGNIIDSSLAEHSLFDFLESLFKLSPFNLLPAWPIDEVSWTLSLVLIGAALLLSILGFIGYRKRDIEA